jgi:hypothetical protein
MVWWRSLVRLQQITLESYDLHKGFNSLVVWWHGGFGSIGMSVFESALPNLSIIMQDITDEAGLWRIRGD